MNTIVKREPRFGAEVSLKGQLRQPPVFLRMPEVLRRVGIGRSTIYDWIKTGRFPASRTLGGRIVYWVEEEIDEWMSYFSAPGSRLALRTSFASSRATRAALRLVWGYVPSVSSFSFPPKRYFSRHERLPVTATCRNRPSCRSTCRPCRHPVLSALEVLSASIPPMAMFIPPEIPQTCFGLPRTTTDHAGSMSSKYTGFSVR